LCRDRLGVCHRHAIARSVYSSAASSEQPAGVPISDYYGESEKKKTGNARAR
jgi:hypothetical protein